MEISIKTVRRWLLTFTQLPQGEQVCLAHFGDQVEEVSMLCKEIVKVLHRKLAQLDNRGRRGSAHAEPIWRAVD